MGADTLRGHFTHKDDKGVWRFDDTNEVTAETWHTRPCGHCGQYGNSNYGKPDPCLGQLPGVTNACCGHGDPKQAYVCFEGGVVLRGFRVDCPCHELQQVREDNQGSGVARSNADRYTEIDGRTIDDLARRRRNHMRIFGEKPAQRNGKGQKGKGK